MGPSSSSLPPMLNPNYSATHFQHVSLGGTGGSSTGGNFLLRDHHLDHHYSLFPPQQDRVSLSLSSYANMVDPRVALAGSPALRGPAPSEPFTGYVAVLKGSRYLSPAQQMLEEICHVGVGGRVGVNVSDSVSAELGPDGPTESRVGSGEHGRVKSRLMSMLDEVYRRYKQYFQQIQYVISSFECVAGLSNAAPYTSLALKSMLKHFQCLKSAISDQLRFTDKAYGKECQSKEDIRGYTSIGGSLCYQGVAHSSGAIGQPNVWRPQRGLPERAVAVLKAWLFEHFLHPYPTDTDKHMLAKQTGLSRNQVSNWFINARVRLWKPMVEEIHSLEMRQTHKAADADNNSNRQPQLPTGSTEPSCSKQPMQNLCSDKRQDAPHKRFRSEFNELPDHIEEPVGLTFDEFPGHHQLGTGIPAPSSGSNSISLTLGLHQNNGICISEPVPLNVARRFGLDDSNASYMMGGFEVQDRRHFGKGIDGQLLHDFVG